MADRLPPDLARLGDALAAAAEQRIAERRRRAARLRRLVPAIVIGAVAFAALTPTALAPSVRTLGPLAAATHECQHRSDKFIAECERVTVLYRPYAVR
jgi:hypothetical protein